MTLDIDDLVFSILQPFESFTLFHAFHTFPDPASLGSSEPLFSRGSVCETQNGWPVEANVQATSANKVRC